MRKPILLAVTILAVFYSCTKIQTTDIGNGLIPPIDGIITKDTLLTVVTNTFDDAIDAKVYKGDNYVIGVINNDPLFGRTTASAFFELKPTFYKYSFPGHKDSLKVDSVVLILGYKGIYGDSSVPQSFNVFEINQSSKLKYDSAYSTSDVISFGSLLGTSPSFDLRRLGDSARTNPRFEAAKNQIRIKLSNTFRDRLRSYDSSANNAYENDSLFRTFFAGFAVVPNGAGEALIKVNLLDTNSKVGIYYSSSATGATKRDTLVNFFRYNLSGGNTTSGSANIITRQRGASRVASFTNTTANDSLVFVQTSPGTYVRIRVPNLSLFPNAIIHRAELIMEQVPHNNAIDLVMTPPRYIMLTAFDSVKKAKRNIPNDYIIDQSNGPNIDQAGGFLSYKEVAGFGRLATYTFNLTRYVQGIVTRKDTSYQLRLYAPSNDSITYSPPYPAVGSAPSFISPSTANEIAHGRVMLGGGSHSQLRMRLRIIYSRL